MGRARTRTEAPGASGDGPDVDLEVIGFDLLEFEVVIQSLDSVEGSGGRDTFGGPEEVAVSKAGTAAREGVRAELATAEGRAVLAQPDPAAILVTEKTWYD